MPRHHVKQLSNSGYLDFDKEQTPHVKQAIQDWFSWHRAHQLPEYATWLASVHHKLEGTLTSTQVCNESEHLKKILAPAFDHAVQLSAPIVLKLSDIQLQHLEQRYTKSNEELRSDFLQTDLRSLDDRTRPSAASGITSITKIYH